MTNIFRKFSFIFHNLHIVERIHRAVHSLIFLIVVGFIFLSNTSLHASQPFTMAFFESPEKDPLLKYAELVYTEAFKRMGIKFQYQVYPVKRCGFLTNSGYVDGEPGRIKNYNKELPNIIRVDFPVIDIKMTAFTIGSVIKLNGWESLRNTGYNVEVVNGIKIAEENLTRVLGLNGFSKVTSIEQSLKKLKSNRIDIFIGLEPMVQRALNTDEFRDSGIVKAGTMEYFQGYPYLHKKHAGLAVALAAVLKQMNAEGMLDRYYNQAYAKSKTK